MPSGVPDGGQTPHPTGRPPVEVQPDSLEAAQLPSAEMAATLQRRSGPVLRPFIPFDPTKSRERAGTTATPRTREAPKTKLEHFIRSESLQRSESIDFRIQQLTTLRIAGPRLIERFFDSPQDCADLLVVQATSEGQVRHLQILAKTGEQSLNPTPLKEHERAQLAAIRPAIQNVRLDWKRLNPPLAFSLRADGTVATSRFGGSAAVEPSLPDSETSFYVLNGNNDERYVRSAAKQLRGLSNATVIVSGFGGHATTDLFPVMGQHPGFEQKTEADRFFDILREEGVTVPIQIEPMATNSGENASNVALHVQRLLSERGGAPGTANVVSFGIPAAAARQTLSYAKQMKLPGIEAHLRAGYIADSDAYSGPVDKLTALRECSTLLRYAADGRFVPTASEHADQPAFREGLADLLDGMLSQLARFADHIDLDGAPSDVVGLRSAIGQLRGSQVVTGIVSGALSEAQRESLSTVDAFLRKVTEAALHASPQERARVLDASQRG